MQDDGTRGNGRPEYSYSWFGWAMEFRFDRDRNAQAATICDAAQFIVSDEPVENSLYFSSNSMSSTRVLRRYESHASYQVLASRIPRGADSCRGPVGLRRFRRFPTIEHDAQSGRSLLKGSRGLAGVQHKAPAAHAFVIHDLRITENTGSRGWREPGGLCVVKQERNVLKGCLSHVRGLMGSRPLLRIGGEIWPARAWNAWGWFLARQLVRHFCLLDVHRHAVRRVNVKARVPVRWQIDFQHRHIFVLKHGQMVSRLFDRSRGPSS